MMEFLNPTTEALFREGTNKGPGISVDARAHKCHKCRQFTTTARRVKGTGTSRHNPLKWICGACKELLQTL